MNEVTVTRSDLIFLRRVLDGCFAELEVLVADGDIDESVLAELDEAMNTVQEYLKR